MKYLFITLLSLLSVVAGFLIDSPYSLGLVLIFIGGWGLGAVARNADDNDKES